MITPYINWKKSSLEEMLRAQHPGILPDEEHAKHGALVRAKANPDVQELLVWTELSTGKYWHVLDEVKDLMAKGEGARFQPVDLQHIARVMVSQAMGEGTWERKAETMGVPVYHEVADRIGAPDSPVSEYVTQEQKRHAINHGFWSCIGTTSVGDSSKLGGALRVLPQLMRSRHFFQLFDWHDGVEKARALPLHLQLQELSNPYTYVRWFLGMEMQVYAALEHEEADVVTANLIAPMVRRFLTDEYDPEHEANWRRLLRIFVQGDRLRTEPIQKVLGDVFEEGLAACFSKGSYIEYPEGLVERTEKLVVDADARAARVWEACEDPRELARIPDEAKKYVPGSVNEAYVADLKTQLTRMKRFDLNLLLKWNNLRVDKDVRAQEQVRVGSNAWSVYTTQRQRPSGDALVRMSYHTKTASGNLHQMLDGFLFADLITRGRVKEASELFAKYEANTPAPRRRFQEAMGVYVDQHGQIRVKEFHLSERVCEPHFNYVRLVQDRKPEWFEVVR